MLSLFTVLMMEADVDKLFETSLLSSTKNDFDSSLTSSRSLFVVFFSSSLLSLLKSFNESKFSFLISSLIRVQAGLTIALRNACSSARRL